MQQLPLPAESPNVRALGCVYRDVFTGLATDTITLTHEPVLTVDDVHLELVFKNGQLLDTAGGGSGAWTRERFTSLTGSTIPLTFAPVVDGTELVFKNGQLLDGHPAQSVSITGMHTTVTGTVESTVDVTVDVSGSTDDGHDVTASGSGSGTGTGTIADGDGVGVGTLEVEPARGTYTLDADTGVLTLSQAAVAGDVFTVLYQYGVGTSGAAGYTIEGATMTLAAALIESDTLIIQYPYRP